MLPHGLAAVCPAGQGRSWRPVQLIEVEDRATLHLYRFSLGNVTHESAVELESFLDDDEQTRAARFKFDRDRRHFSVCRGLLHAVLGDYQQLDPSAVHFEYGPFGKPGVSGGPRFNLSHSGDVALLAIGGNREVGVDVEWLDDEFQIEADIRDWTQREAAVKAFGLGLGVAESSDDWRMIRRRVALRSINLGTGFERYAAAIATVSIDSIST